MDFLLLLFLMSYILYGFVTHKITFSIFSRLTLFRFYINFFFSIFPQAHLRSVDVKILQQLLAVHEGIEAVKWLLEERSTLTSRCSSLTSSQYSLGEGPDTSWRGSWSSLHDPNDKLDNISIGSYLDTLADDMDEYCASSSESVICSGVPPVSEAVAGALTAGAPVAAAGAGVRSDTAARLRAVGSDHKIKVGSGTEVKGRPGSAVTGAVTGVTEAVNRKTVVSINKTEGSKHDAPVWTKTADTIQTQSVKANDVLEKPAAQTGSPAKVNLSKKLGSSQSPKVKPYKNGKIEMDTCKINGKTHLEYDAHWRWVQSQEDVTFL